MKKILFLIVCLITLVTGNIYAQEVVTDPETSFVIDLGTFTGIVAVVSTLVTQITKVVPAISDSKLIKILISVGTGIVVCMICWLLKATPLLNDLVWWQSKAVPGDSGLPRYRKRSAGSGLCGRTV